MIAIESSCTRAGIINREDIRDMISRANGCLDRDVFGVTLLDRVADYLVAREPESADYARLAAFTFVFCEGVA